MQKGIQKPNERISKFEEAVDTDVNQHYWHESLTP